MTDMNSARLSFWRVSRIFWLALLLLGVAFVFERVHHARSGQNVDPLAIETLIENEMLDLKQELDEVFLAGDSLNRLSYIDREDLVVYVFSNDSLIFWSNNSIALPRNLRPERFHTGFVRLPNVFALCCIDTIGSKTFAVIRPIQYRFPFENEFLSNEFLLGGQQFQRCDLVPLSISRGDVINGPDNEPWFRVITKRDGHHCFYWLMSIALNSIGILLFLIFMLVLLNQGFRIWNSSWWIVFFAADLVLFRWLISYFSLPEIFYDGSLFGLFDNPMIFFESQGESIISLVFLLIFALAVNKHWKVYPVSVSQNKELSYRTIDAFSAVSWILISGLWFGLYHFWIWVLNQSNELLEIHNILSLAQDDLVSLALVGLSGVIFLVLLFTVVRQTTKVYPLIRFALIPLVTGMIFFAISRYSDLGPSLINLLFLFLIIISSALSFYGRKRNLNQISILLIIIFSSMCIIFFVDDLNHQKEKAIEVEILDDLSNEHDKTAEMLLKRMDATITQDTTLANMILNPNIPEVDISSYVKNNIIDPYWSRYEVSVMVCDSVNMLNFSTGSPEVICLPFWNTLIAEEGLKLDDSHFYYIDNFDGQIWYVGMIPFSSPDGSYTFHLIIEAMSSLVSEGVGYPDVLIADDANNVGLWDSYSYARYQNSKLVSRSGDFNYSSVWMADSTKQGIVEHIQSEGYYHWISQPAQDNMIVLSKPKTTFFGYLLSFSYLFVAFYLVWLIITLIIIMPKRIKKGSLDLKSKIQISMVGTLVISFLLIGGGMSYFIIKQYSDSNRGTINEKIQSVLIELKHKLQQENELTADWSGSDYPNLQALLVKFSYVFSTDINIYNKEGLLLSSSRPEVFRKNLTGRYMNSHAYHDLDSLNRMKLIHRENIGSLGYWSAYVPFYNLDKELLAYLNLPYFSKQTELSEEVSTFLVAMFNVYFLLILLAVFIAVLLGNQLTKPLQVIQEKFSGMHFGGKNTEIEYSRDDEIGGLIKAYNQMVMELETSAELLVKSERESAWREMAKQIAHEIKNPLTPMKLSVQHLKRSWDDKVENWDAYLNRVTITLVEQIDSLTAIANEFSQFATMPRAKREEIDLTIKVENIVALFKESESSAVSFEVVGTGPFQVFLDKEQIRQVLTNLITNALQSVPQGRKPEVIVRIEKIDVAVRLSVQDNGSGIHVDQQEKLFQPNFTTKTSGMGLGLAISKNIIDNSDGSIWFETSKKGSTFFVDLPLI